MYAFTFVPFFLVYLETAFFVAVFLVALPSAAPASTAINGIGMVRESAGEAGDFKTDWSIARDRRSV